MMRCLPAAARVLRVLAAAAAAVTAAGCITPYRMDVQQGNVVTQEMVDQLKPGMTKAQVRFVLGTPLVTDPFHPDRWDYFYSLRKGRDENPEKRLLTVVFQNDKLVRIEGDITARAHDLASGEAQQPGKPAGEGGETIPPPTSAPPERADFRAGTARPL